MEEIKYYIKPRLYLVDQELWSLSDEIHQMSISQIQDGIDSCQLVVDGKYLEMSWGLEIFEMVIQNDNSKLYYNDLFIRDISTVQLYNMLIEYRDALQVWEEKNKPSHCA